MRVALVSTWQPRSCAVAAFATALREALRRTGVCEDPVVVAASRYPGEVDYGPEVVCEIWQGDPASYRAAAETLNGLGVDVVLLQHGSGLYGGQDGYMVLEFARHLQVPLVTVVHSVRQDPTPGERHVLTRLGRRSRGVVALSSRARGLLESVYAVPAAKTACIPRGVCEPPDAGRVAAVREELQAQGRPVILTPGTVQRGRGLELALEALRLVRPHFPDLLYVIAGGTPPGERAARGEEYREHLLWLARRLGLQENVRVAPAETGEEDVPLYLAAADVVLLPYPRWVTDGSAYLLQALAFGKPVVSTPSGDAVDLLAAGAGMLVAFSAAEPMARALEALLGSPALRAEVGRKARACCTSGWSEVAAQYGAFLESVLQVAAHRR